MDDYLKLFIIGICFACIFAALAYIFITYPLPIALEGLMIPM